MFKHDGLIKIIADDREKRSGLPNILANYADIDFSVERML